MKAPKISKIPGRRLRYLTKEEHTESSNTQTLLAGKVLDIYNSLRNGEETDREVEFFFYTSTAEKAKELVVALKKLKYKLYRTHFVERFNSYSISGHTDNMKMATENIAKWAEEMCTLGNEHDCKFDGWGTLI